MKIVDNIYETSTQSNHKKLKGYIYGENNKNIIIFPELKGEAKYFVIAHEDKVHPSSKIRLIIKGEVYKHCISPTTNKVFIEDVKSQLRSLNIKYEQRGNVTIVIPKESYKILSKQVLELKIESDMSYLEQLKSNLIDVLKHEAKNYIDQYGYLEDTINHIQKAQSLRSIDNEINNFFLGDIDNIKYIFKKADPNNKLRKAIKNEMNESKVRTNLYEYTDKLIKTMVDRFKPQTEDNEETIAKVIRRFEQVIPAIEAKLKSNNPLVKLAIPKELQTNNQWRDITKFKDYNSLKRTISATEKKKKLDAYGQAIEFFKMQPELKYVSPAFIGAYIGRFKRNLNDIIQGVEEKNPRIVNLIPSQLLKNNEYKNILSWKNFHDIETLLDSAFPLSSQEQEEVNTAIAGADMIYKNPDTGIEIILGDAAHKCVRYTKMGNYPWCIGRSSYEYYRFGQHDQKNNRMFYFVFDRTQTDESRTNGATTTWINPYHVVVIHVTEGRKYLVSTANNNGDLPAGGVQAGTTWEDLGNYFKGTDGQRMWNKIKDLKEYFVFKMPSEEEILAKGLKGTRLSLEQYLDYSPETREMWLKMNAADRNVVTGEILESLDEEQLNELINYGRKFSYNELEGNTMLLKRYANFRTTAFPEEPIPYPFLPYMKENLQEEYYQRFEEDYMDFHIIEKYMSKNIVLHYIDKQINKLAYLPEEAFKYFTPKQEELFNIYSIIHDNIKIKTTYSEGKDLIGTVKAPTQTYMIFCMDKEYFRKLEPNKKSKFLDLIKSCPSNDKYVEFIWGIPRTFSYNEKLYFYVPEEKIMDDKSGFNKPWCLINEDGDILIKNLKHRTEEGLSFFKDDKQYNRFCLKAAYPIGSNSVPLIAGKDFDEIRIKDMSGKESKFSIKDFPSVLKESNNNLVKKFKLRSGILK